MSDKKKYAFMPENRARGLRWVLKKCGEDSIFVFATISSKRGNNMAQVVFVERVNASWSVQLRTRLTAVFQT
ncbi:MAG: hypothetical protein OXF29_04190 [Hyphomicrobiales bacterium]|nr:hypothetical protein [Hyphomicrobiales bacterium]